MRESDNDFLQRASLLAQRAAEFARTRRGRRIGIAVSAILLIFSVAGFFVVPHILRGILTGQVATALHRPLTVTRIRFNPYTLRLKVDGLRVDDHSAQKPFVEFSHLDVKVSWTSLFRLAPVITEVTLDKPGFDLLRKSDGAFNFDDLITPAQSTTAPSPAATPSAPLKFSVSNIRIIDGDIRFDDEKVGVKHAVSKIQLNVPFIANLPGKVDVVVQPLLQMTVDGEPIRIEGASRPFAGSLDTAVNLNFHRIDLPRYVGYLPPSIAIKLPSGALSLDMLVHFRQSDAGPSITVNGAVALDQLDLRDSSDAPVLAMDHGEIKITNVAPLDKVAYLRQIALVGLKANLTRNHDGTLNFASLVGPSPPPIVAAATPAGTPSVAAQPTAAPTESAPFDAGIDSIKIIGGSVYVTDLTGAQPAKAALEALNATVNNLRLNSQVPAEFQMAAKIQSGGNIAVKGSVDLAKSDANTDLALDHVDLPALQLFAQQFLAATVASGEFTAHGTLKTHFAGDKFNLHAEPADVAIDNLAIQQPKLRDPPVAWTHLGVSIANFDLASHQVDVKEVRGDAIKLFVKRSKSGDISLMELIKQPEASAPGEKADTKRENARNEPSAAATPSAPTPLWGYQIESISVENTDARFEDRATKRRVHAQFSPLNIHLKNVSSDFAKTSTIEIDGVRNKRGNFKVEGTAAIIPLNANLHIESQDLDMAAVDDYVSTKLNAEITSASLTTKSDVEVAQVQKDFHLKYKGNVALTGFSAIDKLTGDSFINWKSLSLNGVDAEIGEGAPKVHVGDVALSSFNARLILNSSGKLNLSDIVASPNEAPKSLTRTDEEQAAAPVPTPAPTAAAPAEAAHPIDADILVEKVALDGGHVDYSDDFIQPHYSADLTDIAGSIGAFGTRTQQPAEVSLQGQVNGSAPLNIDGAVNPLTPRAFVDISAKAEGIELTGLSPYSTKYTGYPITKGSLNVDVHYLMKDGELTANNHLFIDQLTFGDRVENSSAANLPVRFAVAVLKNSRGEIDLNIPVSGSLSDPQFSIGSVIWGAFLNVITKAVTSPFTLLASAVNGVAGGDSGGGDLSYVDFDPGLSTLTPDAKKNLTTLANALQDHPALKLSICGRVDPDKDVQGMREAWMADQVRAQKMKAEDIGDPTGVELTPADYDKFLRRAYFKANFAKPRDFIGIAKSQPPDEMKKLMIDNAPISSNDLSRLANARANTVRQYLAATVSPSRISIVTPKLDAEGIKEGPTTRADLSLH